MEQVKELFTDCTDVFEELMAVKKHLAEKIKECQSGVENIQNSLNNVDASSPEIETKIQVQTESKLLKDNKLFYEKKVTFYDFIYSKYLLNNLEAQEEQMMAVLKEVGLVSSVGSPQVLEDLSLDCSRLKEAVSRTKDMIYLKRKERDKGLLKVLQGLSSISNVGLIFAFEDHSPEEVHYCYFLNKSRNCKIRKHCDV